MSDDALLFLSIFNAFALGVQLALIFARLT